MKCFYSFNIVYHDKGLNASADKFVVLGSRFENSTISSCCEYNIEVLTRPADPNNLKHWQVFDDDAQVLRFLQSHGEFSN